MKNPDATKRRKHVAAAKIGYAPVSVMATLLQAVAELGYDTDQVLAGAGVSGSVEDLLTGKPQPVSMTAFAKINQHCNAILRNHVTEHHGSVCMTEAQFDMLCRCVIHAPTLGEAIELAREFFDMFEGRIGKVALEVVDGLAQFHINRERHALNNADFLVHIYGFAVLHCLFSWLIDERIELVSTHLIHPSPAHDVRLTGLFDYQLSFGQDSNHFRFDSSYLTRPVVRTARELHQICGLFPHDLMLSSEQGKSLADRIYQVMLDHYANTSRLPEIGQLARVFHMTDYTMRRRLNEENTAYSKIKQQCQLNIIIDYLRRADLTINEIACRSGFSDASTFRRAFKQWTGKSPSAYRNVPASS